MEMEVGMRKILSHKQTLEAVGNPDRKTLHNWTEAGIFPEPVQIGPNKIGWYQDEIGDWLESRPRGFLRPVSEKIKAAGHGGATS